MRILSSRKGSASCATIDWPTSGYRMQDGWFETIPQIADGDLSIE